MWRVRLRRRPEGVWVGSRVLAAWSAGRGGGLRDHRHAKAWAWAEAEAGAVEGEQRGQAVWVPLPNLMLAVERLSLGAAQAAQATMPLVPHHYQERLRGQGIHRQDMHGRERKAVQVQ